MMFHMQGEYRIHFKKYMECGNQDHKNKIQFNFYLSETSDNRTIIKGNFTNKIPIDDALNASIYLI